MMKKVIKYTITVLVLVIVFFASKPVYMSMRTSQYFKTQTDETMTEWLAESYQEVLDGQKDYRFDVLIWSMPEDHSNSSSEDEYLFPNPRKDHYTITVLQNEKMLKIERTYTERYYYPEGSTSIIPIHVRRVRSIYVRKPTWVRYTILYCRMTRSRFTTLRTKAML